MNKSKRAVDVFLENYRKLYSTCAQMSNQESNPRMQYSIDLETTEQEVFKRPDGLWQTKQPDRNGYITVFAFILGSKYCCQGQPIYTSEHFQAALDKSELERVLHTDGDYEYVWRWYEFLHPTNTCWGMRRGPLYLELRRKNGEVLVQARDHITFKRKMNLFEGVTEVKPRPKKIKTPAEITAQKKRLKEFSDSRSTVRRLENSFKSLLEEYYMALFTSIVRPVLAAYNWEICWAMGSIWLVDKHGHEVEDSKIFDRLNKEIDDHLEKFMGFSDQRNHPLWILLTNLKDNRYEAYNESEGFKSWGDRRLNRKD